VRRALALAIGLACSGAAFAAGTGDDACDPSRPADAHRACLEAQAVKAAAALDTMQARMKARIALWDQEDPARIRDALSLFDADVAAYRRHREAHCAFVAASAADDVAEATRLRCDIAMDTARASTLEGELAGFGLGD
jgi:hypothetical protein